MREVMPPPMGGVELCEVGRDSRDGVERVWWRGADAATVSLEGARLVGERLLGERGLWAERGEWGLRRGLVEPRFWL